MSSKLRLLVVDDSTFMLMAIRAMVKLDPGIEIVGEAKNGFEGVAAAIATRPDIITMDVNMPGLNGIEATRQIMREAPAAIVMLSSMTERGRAATDEALAAGAIDFTPKSMSAVDIDLGTIARQLAGKIRFWGDRNGAMASGEPVLPPVPAGTDLLALLGGEGSPLAIGMALRTVPVGDFPVLIAVDTMSPTNTGAFVDHLSRFSAWPIRLATLRGRLTPGTAFVVPGGRFAMLAADAAGGFVTLFRPDAEDALASSIATVATAPQLVLFAGASRGVPKLAATLPSRPLQIWVQPTAEPATTDPQPLLAAHGIPTRVLGQDRAMVIEKVAAA